MSDNMLLHQLFFRNLFPELGRQKCQAIDLPPRDKRSIPVAVNKHFLLLGPAVISIQLYQRALDSKIAFFSIHALHR